METKEPFHMEVLSESQLGFAEFHALITMHVQSALNPYAFHLGNRSALINPGQQNADHNTHTHC